MLKTKIHYLLFLTAVALSACTAIKQQNKESKKVNIIYILADDLGYGDLSCYGQQKFQTPNIDKLASMGMKFTQHYSGSAVCAPSRSSLLTGQHTGHTPIRGNKELKSQEGQTPLPADAFTIAEMLKEAGYQTGAFGKWGLGFIETEGDPTNQGFDEFYGYNCQRMSHRYYPPYLWHNQEKVLLKGNDWTNTEVYAQDRIQEETLNFIEKNKNTPFFAYVPLLLPHAELLVPDDSIFAKFKGKYVEDKPFQLPHKYLSDYGENMKFHKYCSQSAPHATYAAMVARIDIYVGQIMAKLEELGLTENTIIIFTSDNGPATEGGADPVFFNNTAGLKGVKRDLYEGGIRAPFIAVWKNKIKAGSTSKHISAFWDMMPTFAEIANTKKPSTTDGISFLPTLLGKENQEQHEYLYWEYNHKGGKKAVRQGDWKAVSYFVNKKNKQTFELYNLKEDEKETTNIADKYPEIAMKLKKIMEEAHKKSELFPFKNDYK